MTEPDWKTEAFERFKSYESEVLRLKCQGGQLELLHYTQGMGMALAQLLIHFGVDLNKQHQINTDKLAAALKGVYEVDTWP